MSLLFDVIKSAKGKSIEKATTNERLNRLNKCKNCTHLMKTGNCKLCGCFVADKTKYKLEKCPIDKW
tara:strand:- start:1313 stop:1513 length:201 start_codon:yes stop_codon:yes gene_type:complete